MQKMQQQIDRIARWREAYENDTTGIHKTINDLLWDYAAFQTTVKIVRLANDKGDEETAPNQMLFNLIAAGYWSNLLLGTRRLLDAGPLNGIKGVYSIRSVIDDVEACRTWLSRKTYVEKLRHAEYDTARLRQKQHEELIAAQGRAVWGDPALMRSEAAHQDFDKLSGISEASRSEDDLIDANIFVRIKTRLAALDRITVHVNTHLAHSGNEESRQNNNLDDFDTRDARKTLKLLKEVAGLTGVWFADQGASDLAVFMGDQFENLDKPVISSAEIGQLEQHWQAVEEDIARWSIDVASL